MLVADRVLYFRAETAARRAAPDVRIGRSPRRSTGPKQALDELWRDPPHPPHLLHGDIQPGNVMVTRGEVTLIDFQDLIWGFEIQDVAIALLAFDAASATPALGRGVPGRLRNGRPWPEADPETVAALRAARHLNILNFGLSVRKPGLDEFVARHAVPVVEWMRTRDRLAGLGGRRRAGRRGAGSPAAWATPWRPTLRVRSSSTQSGSAVPPGSSRSCTAPLRRLLTCSFLVAVLLLMVEYPLRVRHRTRRTRSRRRGLSIADGSVIARSVA